MPPVFLSGKSSLDKVERHCLAIILIRLFAVFNNFNPNESLNEIITFGNEITIDQWISSSKSWTLASYNFAILTISEKPILVKEHKFKIQIELESGAKISSETDKIIWY